MKLAISNIAWTNEEELEVAELLRDLGVRYIEVAPTKVWSEPTNATDEEIERYKAWWAQYNIEIVAFQSMLFTHPEYKLFDTEDNRKVTKAYLQNFVRLAGKMNVQRMVFGSPKNRQTGILSRKDVDEISKKFFEEIAIESEKNNTIFCIEPNAPQYNCDFITTAKEGIELVKKVNHPGFGLHLDIACMTLAGDDITDSIMGGADFLKHFHVSAPMLDQVEDRDDVNYRESAIALKSIGYEGYVSIEMRPGEIGMNKERVRTAVTFAQQVYTSL
ncbi:MAG: sugar phosphate isomerase/epimerase family protein [Candidatus Microsaccharimonas sp.]